MLGASLSSAAEPSGDFFEIHVNPFTGSDDTGDGGTGDPSDLNYFYVGQTFDSSISINASATTAANIWVDYDSTLTQAGNLTTGTYFDSWAGQNIQNGRIKSTGYNFPLQESNGAGDFGGVQFTLLKPSATNYSTGSPAVLDINIGEIGATTESNISMNGTDILDETEDFQLHIWADTKKPYVQNPQPMAGEADVLTDSLLSFEIRDSLHGEGDDTGVGTGVNINTAGADITFNDGSGAVSLKGSAVNTCSGVWGSNLCEVTVDAPLATVFADDTRKWKYGTIYTVEISGYEDLASSNQSQLGDANGPNLMDSKVFTFTTEADIASPQVSSLSPVPGSSDQSLNSLISFEITDRKSYPNGMSGSGVSSSACRITISSPSFGSHEFAEGADEVTVTQIDYGYRFTIDPSSDFSSNETVTVSVHDCSDLVLNTINEEVYTFNTIVLDADGDGVLDSVDNCPNTSNADQADLDNDGIGDVCDDDIDGDMVNNANDNCVNTPNADQSDLDNDGIGDVCDDDIDGDTILNDVDNCPLVSNSGQEDLDEDSIGDVCDDDIDGDTILNDADNCPLIINAEQEDLDGDDIGDICDDDIDGDTILNETDNCLLIINLDQSDLDKDGIGDACDIAVDLVTFNITAKPEKRAVIDGPNFGLVSDLSFYHQETNNVILKEAMILDDNGVHIGYSTDQLVVGSYKIIFKGESHLSKILSNISVGITPAPIDLDYTIGDTFELIAGDVYPDDKINSFDIVTMLLSYRTSGVDPADLNKDGWINAPDIGLLILNYFKQGDVF